MKLTIFMLFICTTCIAFAEEDVLDIAARYTKQKSQVVNLEEQRRKTLSDIYGIEKKTNKIVLKKGELDRDKLKLDVEMQQLSRKIISIEDKIQSMTPMLIERLSVVEQMNNLPWFYTILTSVNLADLDQLFHSAKKINEKQAELVVEFLALMKSLKDKKKNLEETAKELILVKKDIENREGQIEKNQIKKKEFLSSLEKIIKNEKNKLKRIKGEGRRKIIESNLQELSLLFGTDFFDQKGKLPNPMTSPIVQRYGLNERLKEDHVHLLHKGHFYRKNGQEKPVSISDGRVRYSGQVEGFGYVVVIDHGGRYYSTYGCLKETNLKINDIVKSKQIIGELGFKSLQFGEGLYFEIRHFSQPQNPDDWLIEPPNSLATL